jgi:transcriptional regulator with XRE-family HTH domain
VHKKAASKIIGRRIAIARERAGFTQAAFAREMDVTSNTACRWEQGVLSPGVAHFIKISKIADCSLDYLLTGEVWRDMTGVTPLCPYSAFQTWLSTDAPKNLTKREQDALAVLRFEGQPNPYRYTIILEQLRNGQRESRVSDEIETGRGTASKRNQN